VTSVGTAGGGVGTTVVVPCSISVLVCGCGATEPGSVVVVAAGFRRWVLASDSATDDVAGGTLALGPSGSVPGETVGRFETGIPETGETPGVAGATERPGGRLPGLAARALLGFPGDSVLSTERLGSGELVFGAPGVAVVPLAVDAPDVLEEEGAAVDDEEAPEFDPVELPDPEPALPPDEPLPPPEPPPPWAKSGTNGVVPHSAATRSKVFVFMAWCGRWWNFSDASPAAGERWRPRSDRPTQKTFVPDAESAVAGQFLQEEYREQTERDVSLGSSSVWLL
jgi:hypothetical protein